MAGKQNSTSKVGRNTKDDNYDQTVTRNGSCSSSNRSSIPAHSTASNNSAEKGFKSDLRDTFRGFSPWRLVFGLDPADGGGGQSPNDDSQENVVDGGGRRGSGATKTKGKEKNTRESLQDESSRTIVEVTVPLAVDGGMGVTEIPSLEIDKDEDLYQRRTSDQSSMIPRLYSLDILLKEGRDLAIRDSCGTSDPYVKFKIGSKVVFKSKTVFKNLNPTWNERFAITIDDLSQPIRVKVKDYDWGLVRDDRIGDAVILPRRLRLNMPQEMNLILRDDKSQKEQPADNPQLGYIVVECTLKAKLRDTKEEPEEYFRRIKRNPSSDSSGVGVEELKALVSSNRKLKTQTWIGVLNVVLVEGRNLMAMDDNGFSDPYVKFKLGNERYKSKYKPKTLNPRWLEQFDLYMYEDQSRNLELSVFDYDVGGRDDILGRADLCLSALETEKTHSVKLNLEDGAGTIHLLVTISGLSLNQRPLAELRVDEKQEDIIQRYNLLRSFSNFKDVGFLKVTVLRAQGLAAADLGGTSDPFCVLELVNTRLQTHTEYKTLTPEWGTVFTFAVTDIHSILEVTVFDANRDKKVVFLGKVAIPLLRISTKESRWYTLKDAMLARPVKGAVELEMDFAFNDVKLYDETRTYGLKDRKLLKRVKGTIDLQMSLIFNHFKAAVRTINPREVKYMQPEAKFKVAIMKHNIDRVSKIFDAVVDSGHFVQSCFQWESKLRSSLAFASFLLIVWNVELYMLPAALLVVFVKNLVVIRVFGRRTADDVECDVDYNDDDDDCDKDTKDEKKNQSIREKLSSIQEVLLQVQEGMDMAASLGERFKNAFNWVVPWLSILAVIALTVAAVILYYIPLRYLILAWGINKFTKKLRAPNAIDNNELLDYLSRVPTDKELIEYKEIRPEITVPSPSKKRR